MQAHHEGGAKNAHAEPCLCEWDTDDQGSFKKVFAATINPQMSGEFLDFSTFSVNLLPDKLKTRQASHFDPQHIVQNR